ncbi:MAG: hypothetical protein QT03_C0001G1210 [archaeon GW2011_AR10]|uniref:DUF2101 family protein n=1 Tax=Candidatus Iainarchaeum sp. TaxID=3101447 RepID=A0A7J4IRU6_9ARCH|nr:MAG: hypothetical protein QT03_C0001G1210 [archaeon GW2011_AR10]HIH08172.1 DUF2101 family protein [Candidatus Diapherotrites archaeon]
MLKTFLEKNVKDLSYRSFIVIALQLLVFLMLLAVIAAPLLGETVFLAVNAVLILIYLKLLVIDLRKEVKEGFSRYALFFIVLPTAIQVSWIGQSIISDTITRLAFFSVLIFGLLVFFVLFKLFVVRNYTYGKVLLSDSEMAVVETDYDLLSLSNGGRFIVESKGKQPVGKKVKIKVENRFFTRKPTQII